MVREYEAPVRVYEYPFELVMAAYHRRFPTCDLIPELLDTQITYQYTSKDKSIEVIERKFKMAVEAPYLLKKVVGADSLYALSRNSLNRLERTLLIECRNESFSSRISAFETCKFLASPDNPNHTIFTQKACLEVRNFYGFDSLCEKVMIKMYSKSLTKTERLIYQFIDQLKEEGITYLPPFVPEQIEGKLSSRSRISVDEISFRNPLQTHVVSTNVEELIKEDEKLEEVISNEKLDKIDGSDYFKMYFEKLTLLEKNNVLRLHKKVRQRYDVMPDLVCILRFLRSTEGNVERAHEALVKHLNWKRQNGICFIRHWKLPQTVRPYFLGCWHMHDTTGHPLYIMRLGAIDLKGFMKTIGPDGISKTIIKVCEQGIVRCEQATKKMGQLITSWSLVCDLQGLSLRHAWRPILQVFLRLVEMLQMNYPEMLHRVVLIRAPKFFAIIWSLISALITENTKKKFMILTDECLIHKKLTEIIPSNQVPCFAGGLAETKLDRKMSSIPRSLYLYDNDFDSAIVGCISTDDLYKRITVTKSHNVDVPIGINSDECVITWDFDVLEGDVTFCIYKQPKSTSMTSVMDVVNYVWSSPSLESLPDIKPCCHKEGGSVQGSYYCESSGTYVLQWRVDGGSDESRAKKSVVIYYVDVLPTNQLKSSYISLKSSLSNMSGVESFSLNSCNLSITSQPEPHDLDA